MILQTHKHTNTQMCTFSTIARNRCLCLLKSCRLLPGIFSDVLDTLPTCTVSRQEHWPLYRVLQKPSQYISLVVQMPSLIYVETNFSYLVLISDGVIATVIKAGFLKSFARSLSALDLVVKCRNSLALWVPPHGRNAFLSMDKKVESRMKKIRIWNSLLYLQTETCQPPLGCLHATIQFRLHPWQLTVCLGSPNIFCQPWRISHPFVSENRFWNKLWDFVFGK